MITAHVIYPHTHTHTGTHSSCCGVDISPRTPSMTDGQSPLTVPHYHTHTYTQTLGIERKVMSCLCVYWSEVLSVLRFFFFNYNKLNSHLTNTPREGEGASEPQTVRRRRGGGDDHLQEVSSSACVATLRDLGTLWHTYINTHIHNTYITYCS